MSINLIPDGGNFADGIAAILGGGITDAVREAIEWVQAAIAVVKTAPDNPYKTDEEIAGAILAQEEAIQDALGEDSGM